MILKYLKIIIIASYEYLWWLKTTQAFVLSYMGLNSKQYIMKIRLICVFFQGACDGNVKTSQNIARKSKNTEILNFLKNLFFKHTFLASPAGRPIRPIDRSDRSDRSEKKGGGSGGLCPPSICFNVFHGFYI